MFCLPASDLDPPGISKSGATASLWFQQQGPVEAGKQPSRVSGHQTGIRRFWMSMRPQACQSAKVGPIWTQSWLVLNLISLLCGSSSPFSEFLLTIPLSRSIFCPCSCSLRIRDEGSSPIPLHIRNTEELGNYRKLGPEK